MNTKKIIFITLAVITTTAGIIGYQFYSKIYSPNILKNSAVYIPSNATLEQVHHILSPLLKNKNSFIWVAEQKKYKDKIKGGKYLLPKGMNNNDLVNLLRSGNQVPVRVIFNNQESLEDLAGRISQQIEADSISLLHAIKDDAFLKANGFTQKTALGMYIPNSYEFYWTTSAEKFRKRMLRESRRFWNSSRIQKAKNLGFSKNDVITLASIVQKETASIPERPIVAGLYLNRYRSKWPLQADPTVIFALKQKYGSDTVIKRVLNKDLKIASPYNTYKIIGLPPGPIGMPDISSIDAVLNATNHNYYYMCASTEKIGTHEFAKTLSQHNKNARKYQRWISQQGINR